MIIQILAILCLMVACAMIACYISQRHYGEISGEGPAPKVLRPFAVFSVAQAFDPDLSIVWDTQIPLLQLIADAAVTGIQTLPLSRCYLIAAEHYPELYDGSTFESWLQFLETEHLIRVHGARVFITPEGREFLAYRVVCRAVPAA